MSLPIALIRVRTRAASHDITRSALNCIKSEHWKDGDETPRRKRMSDTAPQTAEVGVIGMAVMGSNLARNMAHKASASPSITAPHHVPTK